MTRHIGRHRRRAGAGFAVLVLLSGAATLTVHPEPRAGPATARALTGVAIPGVRILYAEPATADAALDRVADLGVRWLRVDAAWSEIAAAGGRNDWSRLDRLVGAAGDRGLSVLLVLGTLAATARPAGTAWNHGPTTDAERAAFAGFAAEAAGRFRGAVEAYEVWNEPNLPGSWAPRPDPAAYLSLLTVTYRAVHATDPGAVVLSGGTGGGPTALDSVDWHRALYPGLRDASDAVAVHPYADAPDVDSGEMARARRIRALMDANGDAAKRLWGTEAGAPTGGAPSIHRGTQAVLLREQYDRWAAMPNAGPLIWYTLSDFGGGDREDHFGLLDTTGTGKPAYDALRDWIRAGPP